MVIRLSSYNVCTITEHLYIYIISNIRNRIDNVLYFTYLLDKDCDVLTVIDIKIWMLLVIMIEV